MKKSLILVGSILVCLVLLPSAIQAAEGAAVQPSAAAPAPTALRVVFVGKEVACDCTRKAIDATWKAVEPVLAKRKDVALERLQIDTQADKVQVYRKMKPMIALPAIYVLDGKGRLKGLLQGKVSESEFGKLLE